MSAMRKKGHSWRWFWCLMIAAVQLAAMLIDSRDMAAQVGPTPATTSTPAGSILVRDCLASTDHTETDLSYYATFCETSPAGVTFSLTVTATGETRQLSTDQAGEIKILPLPLTAFTLREDPIPEGYWEPFVDCTAGGDVDDHTVTIEEGEVSSYFSCYWFRIARRSEEPGGQPCLGLDPPPGQVYLFAGRDFTPGCEAFLSGDSDLGDNEVGVGDNQGSSIKVGQGVRAMLCDAVSLGGACSVLVATTSFDCGPAAGPARDGAYSSLGCANIGDDRVTSIKVVAYDSCAEARPEANEVILYSLPDFAGACQFLGMGVRIGELRDTVLGPDGARSVRVGNAAAVILCAEADLNRCDVMTRNTPVLNLGAAARGRSRSAAVLPRSAD